MTFTLDLLPLHRRFVAHLGFVVLTTYGIWLASEHAPRRAFLSHPFN